MLNIGKSSLRNQLIIIMFCINVVFILLLVGIGVIALRVGNILPTNTDIFVIGKNPSVIISDETDDGVLKWETSNKVNIFKNNYVNDNGKVIIESQNGDKVFAPGVTLKYTYTILNNGNVAVIYDNNINFILNIDKENISYKETFLKVRLYTDNNKYIIGDENMWVNINEASLLNYPGILGASSYENFNLEIWWPYEQGSDYNDTLLGNYSSENDLSLNLKIDLFAEEAVDPYLKGGIEIEVNYNDVLGTVIRILWIILLITNIALLIYCISIQINNKLKNKNTK